MYILKKLDIKIPEGSEVIAEYASGVLVLSIVALLGFMNVFVYFLNSHLVQRYDIKNKYPKFSRIIGIYEKSSLIFILIESLICVVCLIILILIISALYLIKRIVI